MAIEGLKKWVFRANKAGKDGHPFHNYVLTWRDGNKLCWSGFDTFEAPGGSVMHREFNGSVDGTQSQVHDELPENQYVVTRHGKGSTVAPAHHIMHATLGDAHEDELIDDGVSWATHLIGIYGKPWEQEVATSA